MRSAVLIVIDGMRPDAIAASAAVTLRRLIGQGASTMSARTVLPSISLPCHTSMFYGVPPERHGIVSNAWKPIEPPIPSVVDVVYEAGRSTAMFYNWEPLRDLAAPLSVSESHHVRWQGGPRDPSDARLFRLANEWMRSTPDFGFAFVYFGAADNVGHKDRWMSEPYFEAIREADRLIETEILPALPPECLLIVASDHGGHDWTHGEDCEEDMTVPIILRGEGIAPGSTIQGPASLMDLPRTIVDWLGIEPHADWLGKSFVR
jgi:predicted AlkP superfamily pyrophosphatase or phosphodiesterase